MCASPLVELLHMLLDPFHAQNTHTSCSVDSHLQAENRFWPEKVCLSTWVSAGQLAAQTDQTVCSRAPQAAGMPRQGPRGPLVLMRTHTHSPRGLCSLHSQSVITDVITADTPT